LYTFLPYHFIRGETHAFLGAYYLVPFIILLVFRVGSESPPLLKPGSIRFDWKQDGSIATLVICVITGSSGVYYAFFACFLILVAGLAAAAAQRRWAPLLSALIILSLTAAIVLLLVWAALRLMGGSFKWLNPVDQRTLSLAALLTLAATLLATIGGLGSLFALVVSPQIRSYNRISIFIGFFALLAAVLLIDRAGARLLRPSAQAFYSFGLALLGTIGIYDQTTSGFVPDYNSVQAAFRSDA